MQCGAGMHSNECRLVLNNNNTWLPLYHSVNQDIRIRKLHLDFPSAQPDALVYDDKVKQHELQSKYGGNLWQDPTPTFMEQCVLCSQLCDIWTKPRGMQANINQCLSQARINWEGYGRKGIRCKSGGMMEEVGHR